MLIYVSFLMFGSFTYLGMLFAMSSVSSTVSMVSSNSWEVAHCACVPVPYLIYINLGLLFFYFLVCVCGVAQFT